MRDRAGTMGAHEIDVPQFVDARGRLAAFEALHPLPFKPARTFVISDVPPDAHRARHIVRCAEFLWMAMGACRAIVRRSADEADGERQFHLRARGPGLYLPEGVWVDLCEFGPGSVMVCMADSNYVARD